ncbi:cytochrome c-type biogenesis CcmF C-terminal domain-containing protein [Chloroflexota bacterium]
MADIGYIALILALIASIYSSITYILGIRRKQQLLKNYARSSLIAVCGLVSVSVSILLYALITHKFQIEYVALYTSRDLPLPYIISGLWAGNDGSLLFWAWLLSIFAIVAVLPKRSVGQRLIPYAAPIIMVVEAFFLILLLFPSNPFHELAYTPAEGMGLNPMLENPGMIFHPPALLAGYIGLTIPFALAIAALLSHKPSDEWITPSRWWTLLSWLLLGAGNITGAWWAYVELGWGGYWAWDPVENAGLMPWLVATAFLHSIIIQRRKGMFKVWNMVLIIMAFNLAIFGTFLTRSGILSSVHTFGESALGPFFLVFLGITFFGPLGLLYHHRNKLRDTAEMESFISREATFQLNNLLLVFATIVIFIGTIFPAISEALRGVKIEVGESFFNQVNGPIFLAIILLAGLCTLIGWRLSSLKDLGRSLIWPFSATIILVVALLLSGIREWYATIIISLCGFTFFAIFYRWWRETRTRHRTSAENYLKAFWKLLRSNRHRYGGYTVHISIVLMAVGIIGSSVYDVEKEVILEPGESMTIKNYTLTYDDISTHETPSKLVLTATLSVYDNGKSIGKLTPEKYLHRSYEQPVTEVAIRSTLLEDLYVILSGVSEDGSTAFKVLVNPLVSWIWIGGVILILGGLITFWPDRRKALGPKQAPTESKASTDIDEDVEKQILRLRRGKGYYCPQCGAQYRERVRFCSRCGTRLVEGKNSD